MWKCSAPEAIRRIEEFYESDEHGKIPIIPGALEALTILVREFEVHAITARHPDIAERTIALVKRHAGELFTEFHFLGRHQNKGDLCVELGAVVMIDDALHNAQKVGEKGIPVIMLDQPWNQGKLPVNTTRVMHWDEIPDLVRKLAK